MNVPWFVPIVLPSIIWKVLLATTYTDRKWTFLAYVVVEEIICHSEMFPIEFWFRENTFQYVALTKVSLPFQINKLLCTDFDIVIYI